MGGWGGGIPTGCGCGSVGQPGVRTAAVVRYRVERSGGTKRGAGGNLGGWGGGCLTVDTGQDMQTCRGWEPRCEMGGLGGETQGRDVHVSGWVVGHRG